MTLGANFNNAFGLLEGRDSLEITLNVVQSMAGLVLLQDSSSVV